MAKYRLILVQRLFLVYCGFVLSETLGKFVYSLKIYLPSKQQTY